MSSPKHINQIKLKKSDSKKGMKPQGEPIVSWSPPHPRKVEFM